MATLPAVDQINHASARLPAAYEAAKTALANCASIDECQSWANKAAALASYARQADDDTLQKQATRIQSRAVRRCGELLKEFDGRGGDRSKGEASEGPSRAADVPAAANDSPEPAESKKDGGDRSAPTRREVAEQAGMSERQQKTAIRVASVPTAHFEAAVESDEPPTVTRLADMGRKPARADEPVPPGFQAAIQLMGHARRLAEFAGQHEAAFIAGGVADYQRTELRGHVAKCRRFLDAIAPKLREG